MRSPTIPLETKRSQAALVIGTGVALGVLVLAGQRWLPDVANQAANVGAPWLLVAFVLGSVLPTPRAALLGGLVGLLVALASYYVAARLALGEAGIAAAGIMAFWGGVALVGGPTFGLAGHWWRAGAGREAAVGSALLAAAFIVEGVYQVLVAWTPVIGWVEIVVGGTLPFVLARSTSDRRRVVGWMLPTTIAGAAAYSAFNWLIGALG